MRTASLILSVVAFALLPVGRAVGLLDQTLAAQSLGSPESFGDPDADAGGREGDGRAPVMLTEITAEKP